jgi:hypothetical protein
MNDQDVRPRPFGLCVGEFTVPEDFNEPLTEEILSSFEGNPAPDLEDDLRPEYDFNAFRVVSRGQGRKKPTEQSG